MFKTLVNKIKRIFYRKKKGAIPFAEHSKQEARGFSSDRKKSSSSEITEDSKHVKKQFSNDHVKRGNASQKRKLWNPDEFHVPPVDGKTRFHDLDLPNQVFHAIADLNFQYCTPVQAGILPETLNGKDAIGQAQTGTGKSAAFLISIITTMIRKPLKGGPPRGMPRALILAPTRELVLQIEKDAVGLCKYTPFRIVSIYGGTGYERQMKILETRSVDIVVATPGRLLDFQQKKLLRLDKIEVLVLDEADRMLDMGFIPDVRKIVYSTPHKSKRQTFFYSATLSPEVTRLAEQWTVDPCVIKTAPDHVASDSVEQFVYITTSSEKFSLLYNLIISNNLERVLVFTNRRDQARDLSEKLLDHGVSTALISGEVHQNRRIKALEGFREGKFRILVATDVAARGIHIDDISHVINYNLPQDPENYVHRIGRTGRAGSNGISVSFACEDDSFHIPDIETFLGNSLICEHPDESLLVAPPAPLQKYEALTDNISSSKKSEYKKPDRKKYNQNNRTRNKTGNRKKFTESDNNGSPIKKDGDSEAKDRQKRKPNRNFRKKPPHKEIIVE